MKTYAFIKKFDLKFVWVFAAFSAITLGLNFSYAHEAVTKVAGENGETLHKLEKMEPTEPTFVGVLVKAFGGKAHATKLRGTHAKGICAKARFDVIDIDKAEGMPNEIKFKLKQGFFAAAQSYTTRVRFANAEGAIQDDHKFDPRAVSLMVDRGNGQRQDFVLQNSPVFPIPTLEDFILVVLQGQPDLALKLTGLSKEAAEKRLLHVRELVSTTFPAAVQSYFTQTYWSGTAFALGEEDAVKYLMTPCKSNSDIPTPTEGENFLQDGIRNHLNSTNPNQEMACFDFGIQILNAEAMTDQNAQSHDATEWVENAGLIWNENQAPVYNVAKVTFIRNSAQQPADCDDPKNTINVMKYTVSANRGIGQINRGRRAPEEASAASRSK